jgi:hypothetical protein
VTDRIFRAVTTLLERGRVLRKETRGLVRQLRDLRETVDDETSAAKNKSRKDRDSASRKQSSGASKDLVDRLRDL